MRIAILIPTLGRADALAPLLQNLRQVTEFCYRVYFVVDQEDQETRHVLDTMPGLDFTSVLCDGTYPEKVAAGVAASTAEGLITPLADDVVFHDGWVPAALKHFEANPEIQVVGTRDLTPATAGGKNVTMPIVRRSYVEHPGAAFDEAGVLFHQGYHHNAVERELWQLAMHRGVAVFEPEAVIEHRHHSWGTREVDETDRKGNMANWDADLALYHERERLWRR